jgi:hypothetical protein
LNFHYGKSMKIIGGVDLNPDKHITEYNKRYMDRSPENKLKNPQIYLNALAARKYQRYINMVHGSDSRFDKSIPFRLRNTKDHHSLIDVADQRESAIPVNEIDPSLPRDTSHPRTKDMSSKSPHKGVPAEFEPPIVDTYMTVGRENS